MILNQCFNLGFSEKEVGESMATAESVKRKRKARLEVIYITIIIHNIINNEFMTRLCDMTRQFG